mmetsp:Transcript_3266/g.7753  ORF Transcript_3266/g.7753 Transcript_3266/m.7753 type:complete len:256 (-) Transcript_3266:1517-2284(-)
MTFETTIFLYQAYLLLYCDDKPDLCPADDKPDICPEDDKPHLCPEDSDSFLIPKRIFEIKRQSEAGPPKEVSINSENEIDSVITVESVIDHERGKKMMELIYLVMLAERKRMYEEEKQIEELIEEQMACLATSLSKLAKDYAEDYAATMSKRTRKKAAAFIEELASILSTCAEDIDKARPEGVFNFSSSLLTFIATLVTVLAPVAKTVAEVFANAKRSKKRRNNNGKIGQFDTDRFISVAEDFADEKRSKKRRKI